MKRTTKLTEPLVVKIRIAIADCNQMNTCTHTHANDAQLHIENE